MNQEDSKLQNTAHVRQPSVNWFVKSFLGNIEDCVIASVVREKGDIYDIQGSSLPPECFRTKLCWNCVHMFDEADECAETFVCKKHLELFEDYYTAMVRIRNIERYGELDSS
jgi:hypothetical protein